VHRCSHRMTRTSRRLAVRLVLTWLVVLPFVACRPGASTPPAVIGLPVVGQVLRASPGTWTEDPTSFAFRWEACDDGGQECVVRRDGPRDAYMVRAADAGRRLRVVVTAENADGHATSASGLTAVVPRPGPRATAWSGWATSPDRSRALGRLAPVTSAATVELVVDPEDRHQTWIGAGGAMTDSTVALIERAGPDLTEALFDPQARRGARLNLVRMPLSATDFSTRAWSWQDDPALPPTPPAETQRAIDAVYQATERQPHLGVVASAWSAPGWMKDSDHLEGGGLAAGREQDYADLLVAQARALLDADVPLLAMTLGNEPGHSDPTYPTMTMTDAQLTALATAIDAPLAGDGVDLWALDHNWADRPRLDTLLAATPGSYTAAAFHCYAGDPTAMGGLAIPSVLTECTGGEWDPDWGSTFRWQARNLVVTPVTEGSTGLILWNLALDPDHGPHTGGCSDCRGIVTVDPVTGAWEPGPEYYLLAHVSRAADPGATRVGLSTPSTVPAVAFANPDGQIGIFAHNATPTTQVLSVRFADGETFRATVAPGELVTLRGSPPPPAG
jgi:glucosylceramidase